MKLTDHLEVLTIRYFGLVLGLALLAGCSLPRIEICPAGLHPVTTANVYFGRSMDGGIEVSEAEWQRFVDKEITPRFPSGFTIEDGLGQWLGANGLVREKTKHLMVVFGARPGEADKLKAIRAAYETRFHQESVGLVETPGCGSFGSVAGDTVSSPPGR